MAAPEGKAYTLARSRAGLFFSLRAHRGCRSPRCGRSWRWGPRSVRGWRGAPTPTGCPTSGRPSAAASTFRKPAQRDWRRWSRRRPTSRGRRRGSVPARNRTAPGEGRSEAVEPLSVELAPDQYAFWLCDLAVAHHGGDASLAAAAVLRACAERADDREVFGVIRCKSATPSTCDGYLDAVQRQQGSGAPEGPATGGAPAAA
ncbi:unnamed protein product [Prorocentrum cordatum]|uniref:Uncharacterized protein n=1 Tax=Prorocentrum cordatum TaxID=2364126 RepID=A0ABN9X7X4_9DINO|nr:unnamed protein product [Polarella glacialis]